MAEADLNKVYVLTNSVIGSSNALASTLDTDELIIEPKTNFKSSQQWFLTPTSFENYYRLHTSQKNSSYALDIRGYDGTDRQSLHFHDVIDAYFGQYWRIDPWGDGTAKLSNNYTGDNVLLDVNEQGDDSFEPLLSNMDEKRKGQHWKFEVVGSGEPGQPITPTGSPTGVSPPSSTSTRDTKFENDQEGGEGLATPAIAGIAVGGAVVLILAVVLLLSWRKKWLCFGKSGGSIYSHSEDRRPRMSLAN